MKCLHNKLPGKFSTNDGSIDFYLRIRNLIDKKKSCIRFRCWKR